MIIEQLYESVPGGCSSSPSMPFSKTHNQNNQRPGIWLNSLMLTYIVVFVLPWCCFGVWLLNLEYQNRHYKHLLKTAKSHTLKQRHWGPLLYRLLPYPVISFINLFITVPFQAWISFWIHFPEMIPLKVPISLNRWAELYIMVSSPTFNPGCLHMSFTSFIPETTGLQLINFWIV